MTYASNVTSGRNAALGYSARRRAPQRERKLNVGYMLFAVGAVWIFDVNGVVAPDNSCPRSAEVTRQAC